MQHLVKFGMIAGARNVAFFNRKRLPWARKVTSVARRVADGRFCGRTVVGSCSDRSRIVNDVSSVFEKFFEILESHLSWQAQYLVMLEATFVAPRIVNNVSYVTRINHESHFSWQAQYFVVLEGNLCCAS